MSFMGVDLAGFLDSQVRTRPSGVS
jgi:hypothetical protein